MPTCHRPPSSSKPAVFVHAFGCQMNAHEGERLLGMLLDEGYQEAITPELADLIVLHTCAVREHAVHKAVSEVGRLALLKHRRSHLKIGLTGCVAQSDGATLLARAPGLDFVIGSRAVVRLPAVLRRVVAGERVVDVADGEYLEIGSAAARRDALRAYVTIIEGCDKFCSFCIVPHTRGREYSRPAVAILDEVRDLVADGYREVTLLGQTVNAYGRKGGGAGESQVDFPGLLEQVSAVDGLARVRFVTSHPNYVGPELIEVLASQPKVCEYMHLPLQAGSDPVLARMNRGYTVDEYLGIVDRLRRAVPGVALVSDFIVGFPGESEADFRATLDAVKTLQFASIFAFMYSPRPHTRAEKWGDPIPVEVKSERLERLLAAQRRIAERHNRALVGTLQEVLVEGSAARLPGKLEGRTRTNRRIAFDGPGVPGEVVQVRVTAVERGALVGGPAVSASCVG
ncbi:MAG TPA: tRNA (N6-isopentenyl adenosine(37)-C2)-methylthiotransferase MiaB [bacterium]